MNTVEHRLDRRRLRAERSQSAVVDAMLALLREGNLRPGTALLAQRAGVSERTLFRLFDDLEALHAVAVETHLARVAHLFLDPERRGSQEQRIEALVEQRVTLYEEVAPVMRAAALKAPFSPAIQIGLRHRWRRLRTQVEQQFRPELERLADQEREELVLALDAAAGLENLEYLHQARGLDASGLRAILRRMLRALLQDGAPHE